MVPYKVGSIEVKQTDISRPHYPLAAPTSVELLAGHQKTPQSRALPSVIVLDRDQIITLRDGTKLRADIYRPKTDAKVPAIVHWGPYGKSGSGLLNIKSFPLRAGIPEETLSGFESFEGLDPAEWIPRGYAIVNVDSRGTGNSEGNALWWGSAEGRDGYDTIEELAKLPWSNGKLALAGNSWLAIAQWFIAAEQPPHLAAIAPLEGLSDTFRENAFRGGIPDTAFASWVSSHLQGRQQQEDFVGMVHSSSITNEYFEDKRSDFSKIKVPAYIGASYSNDLHVIGSLRAFEEIPHENKWLNIHGSMEWYDLYTSERTEDLNRFFDYFLKGVENGWPGTPSVRAALLRFNQPAIIDKPFSDLPWHLPSAAPRSLYLTPNAALSTDKPAQSSIVEYQADTDEALVFNYTFPQRTTIVGPSTLVVDVASPDHDDLDIYTHIFKADNTGAILTHLNIPIPHGLPSEVVQQGTSNSLFRYWGPAGILRASQRHVSPEKSGKTWKTLSHEQVQKVKPGEILRLEIQLWPVGIVFEAGEQLILKISGEKLRPKSLDHLPKEPNPNRGKHLVHLGGRFESRLDVITLDV